VEESGRRATKGCGGEITRQYGTVQPTGSVSVTPPIEGEDVQLEAVGPWAEAAAAAYLAK
jgi:hypothetical protein